MGLLIIPLVAAMLIGFAMVSVVQALRTERRLRSKHHGSRGARIPLLLGSLGMLVLEVPMLVFVAWADFEEEQYKLWGVVFFSAFVGTTCLALALASFALPAARRSGMEWLFLLGAFGIGSCYGVMILGNP